MSANEDPPRDEARNTQRLHIIGETECDLIVTIRISKASLADNANFITALSELVNLL